MADPTYIEMKDRLFEQTISKQVTIANGAEDVASIDIRNDTNAFLKGYGYSFINGTTYILDTGNQMFPPRTDQEGSVSIPATYGNPYPLRRGGKLQVHIQNATGASQTYTVRFFLLTDKLINTTSAGGALSVNTITTSGVTQTLGTLTAPSTTTAYAPEQGATNHVFQTTVATIDTSVTVQYEGSIDGTNYFNLDINNTNTTYTANGTYGATYIGTLKFVRVEFISEAGGTNVTLLCKYLGV